MFLRRGSLQAAKTQVYGRQTRIYWAVSGLRLIYVIARLPGQVAFGFLAVTSGKAAFLVNACPSSSVLRLSALTRFPQTEQMRT